MPKLSFTVVLLAVCAVSLVAQATAITSTTLRGDMRSFSYFENIFLENTGLRDKDNSGDIERGRGEGYEEYTAKYGNADIGYNDKHGLHFGENDRKLSAEEIINHYYGYIRFKFPEPTAAIDSRVAGYIRSSGIVPIWEDTDGQVSGFYARQGVDLAGHFTDITPDKRPAEIRRLFSLLNGVYDTSSPSSAVIRSVSTLFRDRRYQCVDTSIFSMFLFGKAELNFEFRTGYSRSTAASHAYLHDTVNHKDFDLLTPSTNLDYAFVPFQLNPLIVFAMYYQDNFTGTAQNYQQYEAVLSMSRDCNVALETATYYVEVARDRASLLRAKMILEYFAEKVDLANYEKHNGMPAYRKQLMDRTYHLLCYYLVRTCNQLGLRQEQARYKRLMLDKFAHLQDEFYSYVRDYL